MRSLPRLCGTMLEFTTALLMLKDGYTVRRYSQGIDYTVATFPATLSREDIMAEDWIAVEGPNLLRSRFDEKGNEVTTGENPQKRY